MISKNCTSSYTLRSVVCVRGPNWSVRSSPKPGWSSARVKRFAQRSVCSTIEAAACNGRVGPARDDAETRLREPAAASRVGLVLVGVGDGLGPYWLVGPLAGSRSGVAGPILACLSRRCSALPSSAGGFPVEPTAEWCSQCRYAHRINEIGDVAQGLTSNSRCKR